MSNQKVEVGNFVFNIEESSATLVGFTGDFEHHPYVKIPSFVSGHRVSAIVPDAFAGHSIGNLILPDFLESLELDFVTIDHLGELFVNSLLYDTTKLNLMGLESTVLHFNEGNALSIQHDLTGYRTQITDGLTLATAVVNNISHEDIVFDEQGLPDLISLGSDGEEGEIYYISAKDLFINIRENIYINALDAKGLPIVDEAGKIVRLLAIDVYAHLMRLVFTSSVALGADGVLYRISIGRTHLDVVDYIGSDERVVIPAAVEGYRVNDVTLSLHNNSPLKTLVIPQGVTSIGAETLMNKSLDTVILPETVVTIPGYIDPAQITSNIKVQKSSYAHFRLSQSVPSNVEVIGEIRLEDFLRAFNINTQTIYGIEYIDIMDDNNGYKHYVVFNLINGSIPLSGYNVLVRRASLEQLQEGITTMVDSGQQASPRSILMHVLNMLVPPAYHEMITSAKSQNLPN